jgi:hypothetical protein
MTPPREATDPGSIKAQVYGLHLLLQELAEQNNLAHAGIHDVLRAIQGTLNGNGKPGLCSRMHALESTSKVLWVITGTCAATAFGLMLKMVIGG